MDTLNLFYIAFIASTIILAVCFFALNENCKKSERLNEELGKLNDTILDEHRKVLEAYRELTEENKQLKARLLYERTKDNANDF